VVVVAAEATGPTRRSHMSSTLSTKGVAYAVGFSMVLPLRVIVGGIDWLKDCLLLRAWTAAAAATQRRTLDRAMTATRPVCERREEERRGRKEAG